jgi:hypothetical protein
LEEGGEWQVVSGKRGELRNGLYFYLPLATNHLPLFLTGRSVAW